jgi:aryl-alcohol dehydrogenase-like predicted oxidoreductase
VLAIPGTGDIRHLEQNVAAADIQFTQDELDALNP